MAAVSSSLCEEQLLCSICLEVFTDPVTTPCGHSFCSICINKHWDSSVHCRCPVCNQVFSPRPQMKVNIFMLEMVSQFRNKPQDEDLLVEPQTTAQTFTVLLKELGEEQQATLKQQIKERRVKVQEIQRSVEQSQGKADTEIQEGLRVFTALMESVQQRADSFKQSVVQKHQKVEEEASQLIKQIQTEICELEQRGAEMEQLWTSGDHLSFVQTFTTVKPAPQLSDWSEKTVRTPSYKGTGAQAVSALREELNTEMKTFFKEELEKVKEFAAEVSLDPDTANPYLVLSKDLKQVHLGYKTQNLPDNPQRFTNYECVLGKQKFSSGKFYFEVQVKGNTFWGIGVVKESVDRKNEDDQTVEKGYWTLYMDDDGRYKTSDYPPVILSLESRPEKVSVFVDLDEGLVSFFDVDEESLLYSFTDCCFNDNILPFFCLWRNSDPLILTPVDS